MFTNSDSVVLVHVVVPLVLHYLWREWSREDRSIQHPYPPLHEAGEGRVPQSRGQDPASEPTAGVLWQRSDSHQWKLIKIWKVPRVVLLTIRAHSRR